MEFGPYWSMLAGQITSGATLLRSMFTVGVSAITPSDAPPTTTGRIFAGVGLATSDEADPNYLKPFPFKDQSYAHSVTSRWLWWGAFPLHMTSRDTPRGVITWELANAGQIWQSEAQVNNPNASGVNIDVWLTLELSETWDPSGTIIFGGTTNCLVRIP